MNMKNNVIILIISCHVTSTELSCFHILTFLFFSFFIYIYIYNFYYRFIFDSHQLFFKL